MLKKIFTITLTLTMILSTFTSTYASIYVNQTTNNYESKETYLIFDKEYNIYSNILKDGSVEKTVVNPDGTQEFYKMIGNTLYDMNGQEIASLSEDTQSNNSDYDTKSLSQEQTMSIMSTIDSDTSPYSISEYTNYQSSKSGNVILKVSILTISTGALAIILGPIAAPVATVLSISIIAEGVIRGIDSYAIFYKQDLFYHKTLGSLAKMYRTQFYWDPDFEKKAGEMKYHYSTFA